MSNGGAHTIVLLVAKDPAGQKDIADGEGRHHGDAQGAEATAAARRLHQRRPQRRRGGQPPREAADAVERQDCRAWRRPSPARRFFFIPTVLSDGARPPSLSHSRLSSPPFRSDMKSIAQRIAEELNVRVPQVDAAVALLDDKATVPFIARYRKEATGGLDDTQLRTLEERLTYLRELEERRAAILKSIEEQGKLTPELAAAIARGRHQGAARRSLPAVQAEAPHQGADRARSRARAAGARAAARSDAGARSGGGRLRRRRQGRRRRRRGARRRALDPDGDLRRGRRARRRPAPAALGARRVDVDGGRRARKTRAPSSPTTSPPASR